MGVSALVQSAPADSTAVVWLVVAVYVVFRIDKAVSVFCHVVVGFNPAFFGLPPDAPKPRSTLLLSDMARSYETLFIYRYHLRRLLVHPPR
jgi:hypothetical protein